MNVVDRYDQRCSSHLRLRREKRASISFLSFAFDTALRNLFAVALNIELTDMRFAKFNWKLAAWFVTPELQRRQNEFQRSLNNRSSPELYLDEILLKSGVQCTVCKLLFTVGKKIKSIHSCITFRMAFHIKCYTAWSDLERTEVDAKSRHFSSMSNFFLSSIMTALSSKQMSWALTFVVLCKAPIVTLP